MTNRILPAIALLALVAWASAQTDVPGRLSITEPPSTARQNPATKRAETSITGRVTNNSGQPISNAQIFVRKVGRSAGSSRPIVSDEEGRFRADSLVAGVYSVSAYVPGYVAEADTMERQYYRPGESVTLRMIKGAVISGTVTNSAGEPVIAARVNAVHVRDGEGRPVRNSRFSLGSRRTDDRGVYRVYGLQSGSYVIVVNGSDLSYNPGSAFEGDAPTYYPSTTRDAATELTVHTGDEIGGIDIRYRGERGHIVSGTLSGSFGSDSASRGVSLWLAYKSSGSIEQSAHIPLRGGERAFALYGVPDGEYELLAQIDPGAETAASSAPRQVTVKGSDVTGLDLAIAPLGSISGRVMLEVLADAEPNGGCKGKPWVHLDETVIVARRDDAPSAKDRMAILPPNDATPNDQGQFKVVGLFAGRYRIETLLPREDLFVRSIGAPTPGATKPQRNVISDGLAISVGQRVAELTVTVAEGAATMRGKVVPNTQGGNLPSRLHVHLIPAEADLANDVLRFAECPVDADGSFSITNLAPGRYLVFLRASTDDEFAERAPRPIAWDAAKRAKLRRDARAVNSIVELQRCQRVNDYLLKYSTPSEAELPATTTKPQSRL